MQEILLNGLMRATRNYRNIRVGVDENPNRKNWAYMIVYELK